MVNQLKYGPIPVLKALIDPVYVADVASTVVLALKDDGSSMGKAELMYEVIREWPHYVNVPFPVSKIGNWSRWLTYLFGIDDDDTSFKSFHLLNALSDLMMLPKDMLLDSTIRKEVCPSFGATLIKGILDSFVPDEFCPDAIPEVVLEALDSEVSSI
ncbi:unnamed protein product [Lactuca saligna]|uniref:Uncharacterized protein n=1 Tax=Lactuca saligna TaxID=75948 RepID=A0AA35ZY92_LACSI|nr:unnamed protein product [Lactuca saligna]